jgi:hypothetical protein
MIKKIIIIVIGLCILSLITAVVYLKITCSAIQIAKAHSGSRSYKIISRTGDAHEPASCNGSLIILGIE